uniref:5'-nucleotidase n=1 Tax=Phallusia mammillata TaxID=59560 RepID=A0A6F9DLY6_9ASCI|nr:cytosolic 5'-nucleotidase 3-like [Phallusia mammillata]
MDILTGPNVHIKDKTAVNEKIKALMKGGSKSLQVISDFDRTLSRHSYKGKVCPSCHGILESGLVMSESTRMELQELKTKYYSIEIDHNMTIKEKIPYMIEWYEKSHTIMLGANILKDHIADSVRESNVRLKDGCDEMFTLLNNHSVPLLIFSAGVGDILKEVISQKSTFHPNMKIVSNFMKFNEKGKMIGFLSDLIHVFNKNEGSLCHSQYFNDIRHRHNILLLGDSMGDLHMADGVEDVSTCLKIGYLNDKVDVLLDSFMDAWDIVLTDDQSMDVTNAILSLVTAE